MPTIKLEVKPLSVNQCWQGRRFKTEKYKVYEKLLLHKLPPTKIPKEGKLFVKYEWGFSSSASDVDNPIKPIQDILQKKYDFNDNRIWKLEVEKTKVKKGEEYIKIDITELK
jgi:Holliday junction resolvase RusA-like endonuclease